MFNMRSQKINVARDRLLEALKSNMAIHEAEYNEAFEDYKVLVKTKLEQALKKVAAGNFNEVNVQIEPPKNHLPEYKKIIAMIEASIDPSFELDGDAYSAYFENEWHWKGSFNILAASYKADIQASR